MKSYLDLVQHVLTDGERRTNRTGVDTLSVFGTQTRYDLREGFPLLTTKRVAWRALVHELLWFLRGATNIHDGLDEHTSIWNPWADANGDLGPIYGFQWRRWGAVWQPDAHGNVRQDEGIDQLKVAIETLRRDPDSRRIIVSAWNVADLPKMRLPPCHLLFQFNVSRGQFLDCQLYQRSADLALGVPFNIASYALLMHLVGDQVGYAPRFFIHTIGDAHVYVNHVEGLREQLQRSPLRPPRLTIAPQLNEEGMEVPFDMFRVRAEDITLTDYYSYPPIKFEVAV